MTKLQKWLIVIAIWIIALSLLINKRYIVEPYSFYTRDGVVVTEGITKTDTWTGKVFQKMIFPEPEKQGWDEVK